MRNVVFVAVAVAAILSGCATNIPVRKETSLLSLSYTSNATGTSIPEVVAIVSPEFNSQDEGKGNSVSYQVSIPGLAMVDKSVFIAANQFNQKYRTQFSDAVQISIEEMFQKRGFKTIGPYKAYDDVSYSEKKEIYIISNPKINLYFDQNIRSTECRNGNQVCKSEGSIRLRGEIVYRLQEPLTGQSMLTKRFDIGSLGIAKDYVKEFQVRTMSDGLSGALWDKMMSPESLIDTTDKALSEAVTEVFAKLIPKIDAALSREEIQMFKSDIAQLKSLKKY